MKKINRRMVRNITEQTTRKALNEQQLNEGLLGGLAKGLGKVGKRLFGVGNKAANNAALKMWQPLLNTGHPAATKLFDTTNKAFNMARNTSRARWGLGGALGGALGGYALANAGSPKQPTPDPNMIPPGSMQGGAPYPGYDPYSGYGGYSGGGYNPYADYYGGGHGGGGYSGGGYGGGYYPYGDYSGGGYSGGGYDPAMMEYLMNQSSGTGGTSGGIDPMMLYLLSGY